MWLIVIVTKINFLMESLLPESRVSEPGLKDVLSIRTWPSKTGRCQVPLTTSNEGRFQKNATHTEFYSLKFEVLKFVFNGICSDKLLGFIFVYIHLVYFSVLNTYIFILLFPKGTMVYSPCIIWLFSVFHYQIKLGWTLRFWTEN